MANRTLKVGRTARGARVWLEGLWLAPSGFTPGTRYRATFAPGRLTLNISPEGDRIVSGKGARPVIDIIGAAVSEVFPTCERVSISQRVGSIYITAS